MSHQPDFQCRVKQTYCGCQFDTQLGLFRFYWCHRSGPIMGASFTIFTCACFDYTDNIMQDRKCLIVSCACFDFTDNMQDLNCLIVSCACFDFTSAIALDLLWVPVS